MKTASVDRNLDANAAPLVEQMIERLQSGESNVDELIAAHPEHAETLRRLAPVAQVMANLSQIVGSNAAVNSDSSFALHPSSVPDGTLGDFRLIREVGRGGMGVVYEAEQISLRRRVALKVLPFAATMDPRHLQRFKNEALAAASLEHPNIVPVYGVGCERGVHFYAMKFIEGQTLAQLIQGLRSPTEPIQATSDETAAYPLKSGSAPTAPVAGLSTKYEVRGKSHFRRIAELIAQAADALEQAHSMGIVHRDVKPGNLLLDGAGKVYVSDFGLARFGDDAGMTMSGDLIGTLRYMSPEQALARHGLVDHRTDIYSLGATLYELLTLHAAVEGVDKAEILKSIAWEEAISLRKHDKSIPAELETITLKCLAKNPNERYSTAKELAEDLRHWLADRAITAKPPGMRDRVGKWGRRHKYLVRSVLAVLGIAIVSVLVSSLLLWHERNATYAQFLVAEERAEGESRAKLEAQNQAATTHAVLNFVLTKILAAARPQDQDGGLGYDVKLADAVKAALPFVETSFAEQPLIEALLRGTMGTSFRYLGDFRIAAEQQLISRSIYAKHLGPDHPNTLARMNDLALCYDALGRHDEALKLHEETLALAKSRFGSHERRTLSSMNHVALSLRKLGRYGQALDLHEKTLDLMKIHLGLDDPVTLGCMVNVALDYRDVGRYDHSLALLESARAIMKEKIPDHENMLICLSRLASAYSNQARYGEALKTHEEVLKLKTAKYGPDHPQTLESLQNIASTYHAMGHAEEALRRHRQALELSKAKYGVENPNTLLSMNNVARCYQSLHRYDDAVKLNEETLRIRQKTPPLDQPLTLESMDNLAASYYYVGRQPEALKLFKETLELRTARFGHENMQTLNSMDNLGVFYSKVGQHKDAFELHKSACEIMRVRFPGHVFTLNCMHNLAGDCANLGRHAEAIELYEEVLPLRRAKLGVGNSVTQSNMQGLAISYAALARHDDAIKLYEELLPLQRIKPGVGHDLTHASLRGLADSYRAVGRHDEAAKLYEESLQFRKSKAEVESKARR